LLHRIIAVASRAEKVVGHCHVVWTVTHTPSHYEKLQGVVRDTIAEAFDWVAGPAPVDHSPHLKAILEHTILRRLDHTAGSLVKEAAPKIGDEDEDDDDEVAGWNRRREGVALLLKFCQSDPRSTMMVHDCLGCCSSREEALDNVTAAVLQAGLVKWFSSVTPSKGRHGSTTEALGEQSGGMMCYSILPRVFKNAFPNWRSMDQPLDDDGEGDQERRRRCMQGKAYRSVKYLDSHRDQMISSMLSWAAEPCDYLWMRLQYLDARHSTLVDSVVPARSPFYACMKKMCDMLLLPLNIGPMKVVFDHWGLDNPDGQWLASEFRCTVTSMACQLHWRCMMMLRSWPYLLAKVGEPGIGDDEVLRLFQDLWDADECCLDHGFALKLRRLRASAREFASDAAILAGLRFGARHTKLSNMVTERLLARFKASTLRSAPSSIGWPPLVF
jgi:hypothetical protein